MRLGCKTQWVLQGYAGRWSCEAVNFYLKTHLSLADFRPLYCDSQLRSISDYTAPPAYQGRASIPAVNTNNLESRRKPNEVEFMSPQSAFLDYSFSSGVCAHSFHHGPIASHQRLHQKL